MKTILCFGDSNTYGYAATTGGRYSFAQRWPRVLASALGSGYHVVEEGLPGRTTVFDDPLTEGLSGLATITPLMMSHMPLDLLIVMLGTNDTKGRFGVEAGMIAKGMRRLLQKAMHTEAWRNEPNILLVAPTPIIPCYSKYDTLGGFGPGADKKSEQLAAAYKLVAQELNLPFFDAGTVISADEADGVHLTVEAHEVLGKTLAELVTKQQLSGE
ncbi:SGNH/GDSL hydrolase family protein [Ruminococcaceae bacterium OttesenSCG-928-A16]|nr:SGNH/GDSL hydrolase family protein [Ruminococcaceae bacterium OttesenSCG-928-A16]